MNEELKIEKARENRHSDPERSEESPVKMVRLGEVISKASVERNGKQNYPVLSMTMRDGLILQKNRFSKQIASIDQSNYLVVKRNQLVESFPIDEGVLDINRICEKGIVSPAYKLWDIDENIILPEFLVLFLKSEKSISFYKQKLRGTTARRRSITDEDFLGMKIPLYKKEKQNEIVELSKKAKLLINQNKKLLALHETLVKSQFVKMFGDPVTNPMGWEVKKLGDFIENANNGLARRGNNENGSIVLRLVEVQRGFIDYSNVNRIKIKDNEEKYLLKENDFLFARVNGNPDNVGRCAFFKDIGEKVYHNDHIIRVHFNEKKLNEYFLNTLLNSGYEKTQFSQFVKTSAGQYTIAQDGIASAKIPVPPLALQQKFASFVLQVEKSKSAVQKSLEKAEILYKALMQKYFG